MWTQAGAPAARAMLLCTPCRGEREVKGWTALLGCGLKACFVCVCVCGPGLFFANTQKRTSDATPPTMLETPFSPSSCAQASRCRGSALLMPRHMYSRRNVLTLAGLEESLGSDSFLFLKSRAVFFYRIPNRHCTVVPSSARRGQRVVSFAQSLHRFSQQRVAAIPCGAADDQEFHEEMRNPVEDVSAPPVPHGATTPRQRIIH